MPRASQLPTGLVLSPQRLPCSHANRLHFYQNPDPLPCPRGHEHECLADPWESAEAGNAFSVMQPGSSGKQGGAEVADRSHRQQLVIGCCAAQRSGQLVHPALSFVLVPLPAQLVLAQ